MSTLTLSLEDVVDAREAAALAAEYMRENAEVHERYCEVELGAEERAEAERFEALYAKLDALIRAHQESVPSGVPGASRDEVA